jgi:pyridoxine/pyridoxamine 5'-phosphate oxidase
MDKRIELNLLAEKHGAQIVKRPESWSGYTLIPEYFEFWQGKAIILANSLI